VGNSGKIEKNMKTKLKKYKVSSKKFKYDFVLLLSFYQPKTREKVLVLKNKKCL
jgi:hypothetical protein